MARRSPRACSDSWSACVPDCAWRYPAAIVGVRERPQTSPQKFSLVGRSEFAFRWSTRFLARSMLGTPSPSIVIGGGSIRAAPPPCQASASAVGALPWCVCAALKTCAMRASSHSSPACMSMASAASHRPMMRISEAADASRPRAGCLHSRSEVNDRRCTLLCNRER